MYGKKFPCNLCKYATCLPVKVTFQNKRNLWKKKKKFNIAKRRRGRETLAGAELLLLILCGKSLEAMVQGSQINIMRGMKFP